MKSRTRTAMDWLQYLPFAAGCVAIYLVSDMPRPPVPDALTFRFADKLLHAGAYGVLSLLALLGAAHRRGGIAQRARVEAVALAGLYGVVDELHQSFVPNRSATVSDVVADVIGAMLAMAAVAAWRKRAGSKRPPRAT